MKLIHQVRSPFLFIALLLCLFACTMDKEKSISFQSNKQNIKAAMMADERALYFDSLQSYDSAFFYYDKSRSLYKLEKDSLRTAYSMLRMAQILSTYNDYSEAEATATEALPFIEASRDNAYLAEVYNVFGICYKLRDYQLSIDNYNKAKDITKDPISKTTILVNIAGVYKENRLYNKALKHYFELLRYGTFEPGKEDYEKARILNNIGETYNSMNNFIAIKYLEKALKLREKIGDNKGLSSTYNQMAIYWQTRNTSRSIMYAYKALGLARKFKTPNNKLLALNTLINIVPLKEVRNISIVNQKLRDSISLSELKKKIQFTKIKYDSNKAKAENLRLKAQQTKDKLQAQKDGLYKIILAMAIAVIVIIGGFVVYILLLRHKKEKLLQVYKTETRISKKIHDELANDVFKVMSFAESQDFSLPSHQQKLVQNLDSIYTKTRDISRENNTIDTGENYGIILTEMLADYKTETVNVMVVNFETVNWDRMAAHKKITVYRILQELMVNMKKHSQASRVAIKFDKDDKKITIQYTDNGCGLSDEKLIYKNGLQNAETRIFSVGGSITFDSEPNKGLKAIIVVPV